VYTDGELPALVMRRAATNRTLAAATVAEAALNAPIIIIISIIIAVCTVD